MNVHVDLGGGAPAPLPMLLGNMGLPALGYDGALEKAAFRTKKWFLSFFVCLKRKRFAGGVFFFLVTVVLNAKWGELY